MAPLTGTNNKKCVFVYTPSSWKAIFPLFPSAKILKARAHKKPKQFVFFASTRCWRERKALCALIFAALRQAQVSVINAAMINKFTPLSSQRAAFRAKERSLASAPHLHMICSWYTHTHTEPLTSTQEREIIFSFQTPLAFSLFVASV